jgi:hypothetical protein
MMSTAKRRDSLTTKPRVGDRFYPVLEGRVLSKTGDRLIQVHDLGPVDWHKVALVVKGHEDGSWHVRCFDGRDYVVTWSNKFYAWVIAP